MRSIKFFHLIAICILFIVGCQSCPDQTPIVKDNYTFDLFWPPTVFDYEWIDDYKENGLCNYKHLVVAGKDREDLDRLFEVCENISDIYGYVSVRDPSYMYEIESWLNMDHQIGIFLDGIDNVTYDRYHDCYIIDYYLGENKTKELLYSLKGEAVFVNSYKPYDTYVNITELRQFGITPPCR